MIYSVWNQAKGTFDLYQDARPQAELNAPAPTHLKPGPLGATVDEAAWPLPADAKPIGTSAVPVGRVASTGSTAGLGDLLGLPTSWVLYAAGGALAWHFLRRRRR